MSTDSHFALTTYYSAREKPAADAYQMTTSTSSKRTVVAWYA